MSAQYLEFVATKHEHKQAAYMSKCSFEIYAVFLQQVKEFEEKNGRKTLFMKPEISLLETIFEKVFKIRLSCEPRQPTALYCAVLFRK
jgi:hypothetical protein